LTNRLRFTDELRPGSTIGSAASAGSASRGKAFVRISTNPRVTRNPLSPDRAWTHVEAWLHAEPAWIPLPTERHADVLGRLIRSYQLGGNLVTDAQLATLAIEHGLTVCSADTDFARFPEIRWENPLDGR